MPDMEKVLPSRILIESSICHSLNIFVSSICSLFVSSILVIQGFSSTINFSRNRKKPGLKGFTELSIKRLVSIKFVFI